MLTLDPDLDELKALLDTLNIAVIGEFVQRLRHPHRTSFLGPGKIEEVKSGIKDLEADVVVVNGILRPAQHHFLEMTFQRECIDRPGVILRIFASHAHSPEATAQVTLARLRYELPFLREWIHKAKSGDRPGFLSGGAYATDVYYEYAKTQARRIEQGLKDLTARREIARSKRREKGFLLVSLAGHTNVGKSALLNALSGAQVEVDNRMFSTLSTTTRRLTDQESLVLLTDTVGFLKDLPPDLLDAFNSTLEEIFQADLVLLVLDVSEEWKVVKEKLKSSFDILLPSVEPSRIVLVGNKVDLLLPSSAQHIASLVRNQHPGHDLFLVSAKTGTGLDGLKQRILAARELSCVIEARIPHTNEAYSLASRLRSIARITESSTDTTLSIQVSCNPDDREKIEAWIKAVGGVIDSCHQGSRRGGSEGKRSPQEEKGPLPGEQPPTA